MQIEYYRIYQKNAKRKIIRNYFSTTQKKYTLGDSQSQYYCRKELNEDLAAHSTMPFPRSGFFLIKNNNSTVCYNNKKTLANVLYLHSYSVFIYVQSVNAKIIPEYYTQEITNTNKNWRK